MLRHPRKGRRMGGDAAHQKAMLGNLVASLIAAESLVTTEAKAKALRPVAEKCITAARKGGVHRQRNVVALIRDKDMAAQAVRRDRAPLRRPARRLHPHPEAGHRLGRQRAHGAHRTGLTLFDPAPAPGRPDRRGTDDSTGQVDARSRPAGA